VFRHTKHVSRQSLLFVRRQVLFFCCLLPPRTTAVVAVPLCRGWEDIQVVTRVCIAYYPWCGSASSSHRHRRPLSKSTLSSKTFETSLRKERGHSTMTRTNAVAPVFHLFLGVICSRVLESAYNTARLLTGSAAESILACVLDHVAMNHGCSQHCALHGCRQVKSVGCAGVLA
jgi:hypothetical protein